MLVALTCPAHNDRAPRYMEKALAAVHQGLHAGEQIVLSYAVVREQVTLLVRLDEELLTRTVGPILASYPEAASAVVESSDDPTVCPSGSQQWAMELRLTPHLLAAGLALGVETFTYNGSTVQQRFNGAGVLTSTTGNLGLDGTLTVGRLSSGNFNYHGDIAEIVVYKRALTSQEILNVESYLISKYSITHSGLIVFEGDSMTTGLGFPLNV